MSSGGRLHRRRRSSTVGGRKRVVYRRRSATVGAGMRRVRRKRRMQGGSILTKVRDFLKTHRIISRGTRALSTILPGAYGTVSGHVSGLAEKLGYGRRRRRRVHRRY